MLHEERLKVMIIHYVNEMFISIIEFLYFGRFGGVSISFFFYKQQKNHIILLTLNTQKINDE